MKQYLVTLMGENGSYLYLTRYANSKKDAELYVEKNYPMYIIYKVEEVRK